MNNNNNIIIPDNQALNVLDCVFSVLIGDSQALNTFQSGK